MQGKTDWDILFEIMAVDFEAGIMINIKTKIPKIILILKEKLKRISIRSINVLLIGIISCA